jgi:hypothetical protein
MVVNGSDFRAGPKENAERLIGKGAGFKIAPERR